MRFARRCLTAVIALGLLAPAPAAAHRVWQPSELLADSGVAPYTRDLVVTSDGTAIAAWIQNDGSGDMVPMVGVKPQGGALERQQLAADSGWAEIDLATDGRGNAIAVWQLWQSYEYVTYVATRPPGGKFGAARRVPVTGDGTLRAFVNSGGDAVLLWHRHGIDDGPIVALYGSVDGSFSDPVTVVEDTGPNPRFPEAVLTEGGELILAWESINDPSIGSSAPIMAATYRRGEGPATPRELSDPARYTGGLSVGADAAGGAVITWSSTDDPNQGGYGQMVSERAPGGTFSYGVPLDFGRLAYGGVETGMSADGEITYITASEAWRGRRGERPQPLENFSSMQWRHIEVTRSGHVLSTFWGDQNHMLTSTRSGTGRFGPVEDVRPDCGYVDWADVAIGENGESAALLGRRGRVDLALDRPSDAPGSQQCVDDDTVYGRPSRNPPPSDYWYGDWWRPPPPNPSVLQAPLGLVLRGLSVDRSSKARLVTVDVQCTRRCVLDGRATLAPLGEKTLARAHDVARTRGTRAKLKLKLALSRSAREKIAETKKPLQITVRVVGRSSDGSRVTKRLSRRVRR